MRQVPIQPAPDVGAEPVQHDGLSRVALPVGVNAVETVNMHVLADGDTVTLVDCGVWRPDLPDGGLAAVEAGIEAAGYALRDVARIVVTHAHIAYLRWSDRVERRTRPDGVYEWYATGDGPLEVGEFLTGG